MRKHYFFKFKTGNLGLADWLERGGEKTIQLSIYFGKWRCGEDYKKGHSTRKVSQIETFLNIHNSTDEHYFWLFYKEKIFAFTPIRNNIYNGPDILKDEQDSLPKSIDCYLSKEIDKIEYPEIFSNINSNRKYNMKTISKLEDEEHTIAEYIISNNVIIINEENFLDYLSPIEFETLAFLLFNLPISFCSSFRGSTLKDFDLRVKLEDDFYNIPKGKYWLQVKKKSSKVKPTENMYLFHMGKTDLQNRIIGKDWIIRVVKQNNHIKDWLIKSVFDYNIFLKESLNGTSLNSD